VAHLNLAIPPYHVAHAMNFDEERGTVTKTLPVSPSTLEKHLEEKIFFTPAATCERGEETCPKDSQPLDVNKIEKFFIDRPELTNTRRQDIILASFNKSNFASDIKLELCHKISSTHPRYYKALEHEPNLVHGQSIADLADTHIEDVNSDEVKALRKACCNKPLRVLFKSPTGGNLKECRSAFIKNYLDALELRNEDSTVLEKMIQRTQKSQGFSTSP
jgi:hypothetical protein